ncbi:cation transporter [Aspergillus undulatus]|uniref:cation transporter n=1 Tax=Aspergillus undulatus TaxID=1810928 RepID=UPI003CCE1CB9
MVNNLGFALTPDSMISFQDSPYLMILMSLLAYAGNTFYPCILRLIIWVMSKASLKQSSLREPLDHLLKLPGASIFLLPSKPTWLLFGTLCALNTFDIVLILVLGTNYHELSKLPAGSRLAATIFQAASIRTTGTSSFNLFRLHPAVQFSVLIMMYTSIYPSATTIRGIAPYTRGANGDDNRANGKSRFPVLTYIQDQLASDLWLILLAVFVLCIAESDHVMDPAKTSFDIFPVLFEAVSAYGNIGLSLSYPAAQTSLCGHFGAFSKLVICALMIRGRHRGLLGLVEGDIVMADGVTPYNSDGLGSDGEIVERTV